MAAELDAQVAQFRGRPLGRGPYTSVAAHALVLEVREGGRVVNVHTPVATGVNADGHREILGLQVASAEDSAGWLAFFRDLTASGLTGGRLVTRQRGNPWIGAGPRSAARGSSRRTARTGPSRCVGAARRPGRRAGRRGWSCRHGPRCRAIAEIVQPRRWGACASTSSSRVSVRGGGPFGLSVMT